MRHLIFGVTLAVAMAGAQAAATAEITCGMGSNYFYGGSVTLDVRFSPGSDVGKPGLLFIGGLSPNQQLAGVVDLNGTWVAYQGGLYPPARRFDNGLPGSVTVSVKLPSTDGYSGTITDTTPYVGYQVYVGHGVLTDKAMQMVANRREYLERVRPERVAAGTWQPALDNDDTFKWSLIMKDMTDNNKFGPVLTVPLISCTPEMGGQ